MAKQDPRDDPNTIGVILMSYGLTPAELSRALRFQKDSADILLGEACVRLGFISRTTLETAIAKQRAGRRNSTAALIRLATDRTKSMSASLTGLAAVSIELAEKIK